MPLPTAIPATSTSCPACGAQLTLTGMSRRQAIGQFQRHLCTNGHLYALRHDHWLFLGIAKPEEMQDRALLTQAAEIITTDATA